jgi:hypothetical protein
MTTTAVTKPTKSSAVILSGDRGVNLRNLTEKQKAILKEFTYYQGTAEAALLRTAKAYVKAVNAGMKEVVQTYFSSFSARTWKRLEMIGNGLLLPEASNYTEDVATLTTDDQKTLLTKGVTVVDDYNTKVSRKLRLKDMTTKQRVQVINKDEGTIRDETQQINYLLQEAEAAAKVLQKQAAAVAADKVAVSSNPWTVGEKKESVFLARSGTYTRNQIKRVAKDLGLL